MPASYPIWSTRNPPHTNKLAKPNRWRKERNVTVIEVQGATYRSSKPFNGVLEVVKQTGKPNRRVKGQMRCEVYCSWFGVKPPTVFPQILLDNCQYKIIKNYTGKVIDNLEA